ncbi:tellurite resistance TerB family protein [Roseomonas eburnea]|uniref:Tellurite resistance TerB family protein n=1 Tax=Neoroseomonas eburnea TaxID=1346889 RepID=A0A9X9XEW4_9PROT|nr:DUF533 domain-containing protein [Neoroseomonas eburnea]MBR0682250.1 tellurite resistance TerB family protein [Neoroseomonas eburnea]
MAQFDLGNVLGAVLGGGTPMRGTRRRSAPRGHQDLGRALAMLAGVAIEAMTKAQQQPAPAPPPARGKPRGATRGATGSWGDAPSAKPAPMPGGAKTAPTPGGRGSVPATGPWGAAPAGKPAPEGWAPVPGVPPPPSVSAEDREGLLMLRAMIAAAKADGHVDSSERERIADQLAAAGLGTAARDAALAEFDRAAAPEELAREARDPMLAAQLYAAAVAGAASIEGAERAWLDGFAKALRLDRAATEAIERRIRGG